MRKVNTIGLKQANKVMLMAGTAYNLKKYLKFVAKKSISKVEKVKVSALLIIGLLSGQKMRFAAIVF